MELGDIPVAILAGGLASRLRPITERVPKVLVPVAGIPFLEHQLGLLRQQGVRRVVLCVGYLGDMVQQQFGDGSGHGISLEYSFDGPKLLGTGGAIRAALPMLGEKFFVLYGDSYLPIAFGPVADFFEHSDKLGLMTVYKNSGHYDRSNVVFQDGEVVLHEKKLSLPEMHHIDYGLSLLRPSAFSDWSADESFDLTEVMQRLISRHQLAGFEVHQRFYEIGSPAGLAELELFLLDGKNN